MNNENEKTSFKWTVSQHCSSPVFYYQTTSPEAEFMNANFRNISKFLPNAILKCVFPLDFPPAIDFSSPGFRPRISFAIESRIMHELPVGMDKNLKPQSFCKSARSARCANVAAIDRQLKGGGVGWADRHRMTRPVHTE